MKNITIILFLIFYVVPGYAQTPAVNWWYDIDDMSFGNTAAADIDNDGKLELVFSTYRNDGHVYALNAEDGSLLWKFDAGGCCDAAPLIHDVDGDSNLEVIVPGSCVAKTFCLDGATGVLKWEAATRGSDSPPTIGDIDMDEKPEILHGEFRGWLICLNGGDGSRAWEMPVDTNSWIQTAPAIMDIDNDGGIDFVVANWSFEDDHRIFAYDGQTQDLIWQTDLPDGYIYHGCSFADLDMDGSKELVFGCYDGYVYVLNSEDGSLAWSFANDFEFNYVAAPTSIGDINNDMLPEIVFIDAYGVGALSNSGELLWQNEIPMGAFRGAALADVNGDDSVDVVFGTSNGLLIALSGGSGDELYNIDLGQHLGKDNYQIDHAPVIADFDKDGIIEAFIVGGHAEYPEIQNNYGRAYCVTLGPGNGPDWLMFRRDSARSASLGNFTTTGIVDDSPLSEIQVYPNPTGGIFTVETEFYGEIIIGDILGRTIYRSNSKIRLKHYEIDLNGQPPGLYFIRFGSGKRSFIERIVVY